MPRDRMRIALGASLALALQLPCPTARGDDALDRKVESVLQKMRHQWHDMNVPEQDARLLHDIVLEKRFKRALELGTSTGHSSLWIGWALSKTGGSLITVEIDDRRHAEAVGHFREAGLADVIDARLADAHALVNALPGPFDFVFIDADKDWYVKYATALIPKLRPGGCIAAHNVSGSRGWGWGRQGGEYYDFMLGQPGFETSVHPDSVGGLAVSCKKAP